MVWPPRHLLHSSEGGKRAIGVSQNQLILIHQLHVGFQFLAVCHLDPESAVRIQAVSTYPYGANRAHAYHPAGGKFDVPWSISGFPFAEESAHRGSRLRHSRLLV